MHVWSNEGIARKIFKVWRAHNKREVYTLLYFKIKNERNHYTSKLTFFINFHRNMDSWVGEIHKIFKLFTIDKSRIIWLEVFHFHKSNSILLFGRKESYLKLSKALYILYINRKKVISFITITFYIFLSTHLS